MRARARKVLSWTDICIAPKSRNCSSSSVSNRLSTAKEWFSGFCSFEVLFMKGSVDIGAAVVDVVLVVDAVVVVVVVVIVVLLVDVVLFLDSWFQFLVVRRVVEK